MMRYERMDRHGCVAIAMEVSDSGRCRRRRRLVWDGFCRFRHDAAVVLFVFVFVVVIVVVVFFVFIAVIDAIGRGATCIVGRRSHLVRRLAPWMLVVVVVKDTAACRGRMDRGHDD